MFYSHTSLAASDHSYREKLDEMPSPYSFGSNFSAMVKKRIIKFNSTIADTQPHKQEEYNVASCFQSGAKCNQILHNSE